MRAGILLVACASLLGCDALLTGGKCLPGYEQKDDRCVLVDDPAPDGEGAGAQGGSGTGGELAAGGGGAGLECGSLAECSGSCVDVSADPSHCGGCGVVCPSGICEDGACVGSPAGHVIAVGLESSASQAGAWGLHVVGSAVLVHPADPVHVVAYRNGSPTGAVPLEALTKTEVESRGRSVEILRKGADEVPAILSSGAADVLLLTTDAAETVVASPPAAAALGEALDGFLAHGGIVVAVSTSGKQEAFVSLLDQAAMLPGLSIVVAGSDAYTVTSWTDSVAAGLLSPFAASGVARGFVLPSWSDATTVVVDAAGVPVVVHRAVVPVD
ncbi:MAG: hypothetical protein HOV80_25985 [Polyangiaceae bacterium]|nr:hypothetical protein [Polyangiaceae bacterium]